MKIPEGIECSISAGNTQIELLALFTEALGMQAENMQRQLDGHLMAYLDYNFYSIANKMRALKEKED